MKGQGIWEKDRKEAGWGIREEGVRDKRIVVPSNMKEK